MLEALRLAKQAQAAADTAAGLVEVKERLASLEKKLDAVLVLLDPKKKSTDK